MATVQSNTATLSVAALPVIVTQPLSQSVLEQEAVVFTVAATGTGALTYQWYETTAGQLTGETGTTLTFDVTLEDEAEGYYCEVTDDIGTTPTDVATLTVLPLPVIVTEPQHVSIQDGDTVVFTVEATGAPVVTYQWYETTIGLLTGETEATLSFQGFYINDGASFYVIVGDANGGFTQSVTAIMTVAEPGLNFAADLSLKGPNGWIEILPRMKWRNPYVFGLTYFEEQVVNDTGWVMVADNTTAERAAPQAVGSSFYPTDGAIWDETQWQLDTIQYSNTYVLTEDVLGLAIAHLVPPGNEGLFHNCVIRVDGFISFVMPFIPQDSGLRTLGPFSRLARAGDTVEIEINISNDSGNKRVYYAVAADYWNGYSDAVVGSAFGTKDGILSNDAYGIDAVVQQVGVPQDWSILVAGTTPV